MQVAKSLKFYTIIKKCCIAPTNTNSWLKSDVKFYLNLPNARQEVDQKQLWESFGAFCECHFFPCTLLTFFRYNGKA